MPSSSAFARFGRWLGRGASKIRSIRIPGASAGAAGAANKATMGARVAETVSKLPVVRIIVGSSIGIAILNWWDSSKDWLSDALGIDPELASLLLGAGILVLIIFLIGSLRRK